MRRDPDREHVVIPEWTVTLLTGDRTILRHRRAAVDPRSRPAALGGPRGVALLSGVALALLTRAWATGLAIVVAAVVTADIIHTIGIGWARAGGVGAKLGQMATSSPYSLVAWAAGIVAVASAGPAPAGRAGGRRLRRDHRRGVRWAGRSHRPHPLTGPLRMDTDARPDRRRRVDRRRSRAGDRGRDRRAAAPGQPGTAGSDSSARIELNPASAQVHRPAVIDGPTRIVGHLPRMAVGVEEDRGVAAPERLGRFPADRRAGGAGLGGDRVDLLA